MSVVLNRRQVMLAGGATLLGGAVVSPVGAAGNGEAKEIEVPAAEDLMREHGVLRRALLVYSETAGRIARGTAIPFDALGRTAELFRSFGEEYHERSLEEAHVFKPLARAGSPHATLVRTLTSQHERGRAITAYILAMAKKGRAATAELAPLAHTLESFVRMYEHHAAIEDTIVFPAWKAAISPAQYAELGEQFEDLEHSMFGKDGFEDALEKIAAIEQAFGLSDLNALTAAAPPQAG